MLEAGIKGSQSVTVTLENSAKAVGSGMLEVFATPSMIALMEKTASESVAPMLDAGCGTVGTKLDVAHVSATPVGMTVRCDSTLTAVDGRKLVFSVAAYDISKNGTETLIGEGTHERFIIQNEKFMAKTMSKLDK
ncbi:MAG: thioesterase family protein [Eubacteriales bacterium]